MEKVKNAFSNCGAWIKAHLKVVIAIVAVIIVAIIVVNLIGGSEKRVIKKHLAAITACNDSKVLKTMDLEAAIAWSRASGENRVDDFKDKLDKVKDDGKDDVKSYKESIEKSIDKDDKGKGKVKLLKIVSTTKAKDDKNLKKVVAKVKMTVKPDKEDDDDEDSIWKKEKKYTSVTQTYVTFILYKNKIISSTFVPSYSSYDYSDYSTDLTE